MLQIYLIARSQFDAKAFLEFLERHDMSWRRSSHATSNEELVEAAGRVCYMSFGERQSPRDNAEYIAHHCCPSYWDAARGRGHFPGYWTRSGSGGDEVPGSCCPD